jgi:diguanylate cyclase (GGDEF)-like protein
MAGLARGSRHETRLGLQGGIRGRGFKVVLGCFAGAIGADTAALLARDAELGLRIASSWAREEREPTVTWTSDGLLSRAIESDRALIERAGEREGGTARAVAAAVRTYDAVIGAIWASFEPPSSQSPDQLTWMTDSYARLAGLCMADQDLAVAAALGSSTYDPLTGCLSYGGMVEVMRGELQRSHRRGHHVSACVLDLDGFRRVNDERGHIEGNRVLGAVASALRLASRRYDSVGRSGADAFMVVMPETDCREGTQIAERFLGALNGAAAEVTTVPVGASIGIAEWDGEAAALEFFEAADRAMRVAKAAGGSRVQALTTPRRRLDGLSELTRQGARPPQRESNGERPGSI